MKAVFFALSILLLTSGCATYTRVVSDDGRAALPAAKVQLPSKPNAECIGEWVWNVTWNRWACVTSAPAYRVAPVHPWFLGMPYAYGGGSFSFCSGRGCARWSWW